MIDLDLLERVAREIRQRNASVKRGHPKYTASMTSEQEMTLTEGVLSLVQRIRVLEEGLGEMCKLAEFGVRAQDSFGESWVEKSLARIAALRALLVKDGSP